MALHKEDSSHCQTQAILNNSKKCVDLRDLCYLREENYGLVSGITYPIFHADFFPLQISQIAQIFHKEASKSLPSYACRRERLLRI
jgi:hypothetical protein